MNKSELKAHLDAFVKNEMDNYDGRDLHNVVIPSDKYPGAYIIGHFGKRRIEGVSVAVETADEMQTYTYDVTATIVNHPTTGGGLYKESYFLDKSTAVQSMFDTILASAKSIENLLGNHSVDALMTPNNPTQYPQTDRADTIILQ